MLVRGCSEIHEYTEMRDIVYSLSVVNDTNSTKYEHWGDIVEVSSWHNGKISKYTREELNANVHR